MCTCYMTGPSKTHILAIYLWEINMTSGLMEATLDGFVAKL